MAIAKAGKNMVAVGGQLSGILIQEYNIDTPTVHLITKWKIFSGQNVTHMFTYNHDNIIAAIDRDICQINTTTKSFSTLATSDDRIYEMAPVPEFNI